MPIAQNDILQACDILGNEPNLQENFKRSVIGGIWAFAATVIGAILLGPVGIVVGGVVGGIIGWFFNTSNYKPLHQCIEEMDGRTKVKLAEHMNNIITQLDITDAATLLLIAQNPGAPQYTLLRQGLQKFLNL